MLLDPNIIYFTHSKIRERFSGCGKTIEETFNELKSKKIKIEEIPKIKVLFDGEKYYSENNRRLYLFKKCKENGLLVMIDVVIKNIKNPQKNIYSLNAKIAYK
jgi:hypothetical protein